jgi:NAD(P)H-flavin reductase
MVEVPRDGKIIRKPYSISSPPHWPNKVELCIKQVEGGYVSTYFFNLKVGYVMPMEGPLGKFTIMEPLPDHVIFVATGTGVAPLRAQIYSLFEKGTEKKISLFLGVRHEYEILFDEEFKALAKKHPNFEYIPTISRPQNWDGAKGYVQEQIKTRYPDPTGRQIYACGLVPMVNALKEELTKMGYPKEVIHFEKWT